MVSTLGQRLGRGSWDTGVAISGGDGVAFEHGWIETFSLSVYRGVSLASGGQVGARLGGRSSFKKVANMCTQRERRHEFRAEFYCPLAIWLLISSIVWNIPEPFR